MMDSSDRAASTWRKLVPDVEVPGPVVTAAIRLALVGRLQADLEAKALRPFEYQGVLSPSDFLVFAFIRRGPKAGVTSKEIAQHLKISKAGVSGRLDRFASNGFIERSTSTVDRRSHLVTLTPDGVELADDMYRAMVAQHQTFFSVLTPKENETLANLLAKFTRQL